MNGIGRISTRVLFVVVMLAALAFFIFLFVWMGLSSFKLNRDIYAMPPEWKFVPTFNHYNKIIREVSFLRYIGNSIVVGTSSTIIGLFFGMPAAYSIARYRQRRLALALLFARILPGVIYLVPFFFLFQWLGLLRTYGALTITHVLITLPMIRWILIPYFEDLPVEVEEAAYIDGCSKARIFLIISIPLVRPGIAAAAILAFITSWNDYVFALILSGTDTRTVPIALLTFMGQSVVDWGALNAAATLATLPVIIMAIFVQKHIVKGLTIGGIR